MSQALEMEERAVSQRMQAVQPQELEELRKWIILVEPQDIDGRHLGFGPV